MLSQNSLINKLPLVSIAIITYNQKDFLIECLESILSQDYKNIEIIVADDGSRDGTHDLLKNYEIQYPNKVIPILSDINLGITKNSNRAHFACRGKYIFWMGGDDLMLPNKISKQVQYMEEHPECSVCYHNLDVFESGTNKTLYLMNNHKNSFEGTFEGVVSKGVFNGACSTVVRKDKTPVNGFDERIPIASDWLYWMQTLINGGEIHYINEVLGRYRRHSNNVTNNLKNYNGQIDHLNSCNILLINSPQFSNEILGRYFEILRSLRLYDNLNYSYWLKISLNLKLNLKSLIILIIYLFSFKKIKL